MEIVVVDSSPDVRVEKIVKANSFPITYIHFQERLLPHAARSLGVQRTSSELLVFTDPDIYAPPRWIRNLVTAYQQYGGVMIGALTNATDRWLDWGIHLGKFDSFLVEPEVRLLDFCATANMLCSRQDYMKVGGFENDEMLADLLISWKFTERHIPIRLIPLANALHHHTQSFSAFLRERYVRGLDFGRLRAERLHWTKLQIIRHALITLSGLRLLSLIIRQSRNARRAGLLIKSLSTLPISSMGQLLWLSGEVTAFFRVIFQ